MVSGRGTSVREGIARAASETTGPEAGAPTAQTVPTGGRADRADRREAVPTDSDVAVPIGMVPEGDLEAEAHPAEIATGREWSERTIPPIWWMDRSHCRGDVQRQE